MTNDLNKSADLTEANGCVENTQMLPLAKHAGFTNVITSKTFSYVRAVVRKTVRWLKDHQTRIRDKQEVRKLLELDAAILDDMCLTKADVHYVLMSRSQILPSTRLKLISVQRRATSRADLEQRARYIEGLIPAPFNGRTRVSDTSARKGHDERMA